MNRDRVQRAKLHFAERKVPDSNVINPSASTKDEIYITLVIITVNRTKSKPGKESPGYLLQSAAALDRFARSREFGNRTFMFVCNVDAQPQHHKDAQYLKSYLPFTERYGPSSFHTAELYPAGSDVAYRELRHNQTYHKETYDYMYCLQVANMLNTRYILMVEDDAISHRDLSKVLKYSIDKHLTTHDNSVKNFAYLKLYYPVRWQGFGFDFERILELLSIGCLGGGLCFLFVRIASLTLKLRFKPSACHVWFVFGFILLIVLAKMVGRQNLIEWRRLSKYLYQFRSSPGCCTQAMLYPRAFVDPLLKHLSTARPTTHTDLAIYALVNKSGMPAYQLEPNLFFHVGMFTTLEEGDKNPREFLFNDIT